MIPYILHVSVLIAVVVVFYKLVLEKETHYTWNRWLLLGALVTAFALPKLIVPASWEVFSPWGEAAAQDVAEPLLADFSLNPPDNQPVMTEWNDSFIEVIPSYVEADTPIEQESSIAVSILGLLRQLSLGKGLLVIYFLGVAFWGMRLMRQMAALVQQIRSLPRRREGRYILLEPQGEKASYSFFHYLFISPHTYDSSTFRQISSHEKIHADQRHSIDILLAELLTVLQWFNPFAWAYRKAIRQNLEYQTDDLMVKRGTDLTAYQMSLLQVTAPKYAYSVVANYNQSLLKKRILMMNAQKSPLVSGWKYIVLLALLGVSIPLFNAKTTSLPPVEFPVTEIQAVPILPVQVVETQPTLEDRPPVLLAQATAHRMPETPTHLSLTLANSEIKGSWEALIEGQEMCMRIVRSLTQKKWNWTNHECYDLSEFSPADVRSASSFSMARESGKLVFSGGFIGDKGEGKFEFVENASYRSMLERKGVKEISSQLMFTLFFVKDRSAFIENAVALSSLNLPPATLRAILPEHIKAELVQKYQTAGLSITDNLNFVRSHVKPEILLDYRAAGLDFETHKNFIHSHVKPELLKQYKAEGFDLEKNKNFIYSHVKPKFLKEYQMAGLDFEEHKNFIHSHVKPDLLKQYKAAGFDLKKTKNFIYSHVKPETLKEYQAAGLDFDEHKNFIHSHVKPEFLKQYKAAGFDLEKNKNFIHSHVKPEILKEYQAAGLDLEENKNFIHSHVKPDLLKRYKAAGFDLEKNKNFIYSHVKPEVLQGYQAAGLDLKQNENFIHSHVKPELLKSYQVAGLDLQQHKNYIYSHVKPAFLKAYIDAGYSVKKYEKFIHHHISAEFLQRYEKAGLSIDDHIQFILDRVTPEKVKQYKQSLQEK